MIRYKLAFCITTWPEALGKGSLEQESLISLGAQTIDSITILLRKG